MNIRDYPGLITGKSSVLPGDCATPEQFRAASGRLQRQNTLSTGSEDALVPVTDAEKKASLRARGRVRKRSGEMNKTEAAFETELKFMRSCGVVVWFAFEAMKFRLADNTFYTPDFAVLYADGMLRLIDTKGTTKKDGKYKPFIEEDAKIKAKLAAEIFPISFALAYRLPKKEGGEWVIEEV